MFRVSASVDPCVAKALAAVFASTYVCVVFLTIYEARVNSLLLVLCDFGYEVIELMSSSLCLSFERAISKYQLV
jgi:hypothetical protein